MKGLMRMLMMFGPMLFRQYQKYQRKNANKQQSTQNPDRPIGEDQPADGFRSNR